MSFLRSCLLILICTASAMAAAIQPGNSLVNGLGGAAGFGEGGPLGADDTSWALDITPVFPSGIQYFGTATNTIWINSNGTVNFSGGFTDYTPDPITPTMGTVMVAAWWCDILTTQAPVLPPSPGGNSTGSNRIYYDLDTVNQVVTITWDDVRMYSDGGSGLQAAFQVRLHRVGTSGVFAEIRYEHLSWYYGGGVRAGWSANDGVNAHEIPQSNNMAAMLALATASNMGQPGVFVFNGWTIGTPTANTNADPILFTVTAPYPVGGLGVEDFDVVNGRAYAMTGGPSVYQLFVHPAGDGLVTVTLHADAVYREYDPPNLQPPNPQVIYTTRSDRTAPTLVMPPAAVTGGNVALNATATDGGSGIATYAWSVVSGGGGLTFSNAAIEDPVAITTGVGAWTLRLVVTDLAGNSVSGTTTVSRVTPAPPPPAGAEPHLLISGPAGLLPTSSFAVRILADTAVTGLDLGAISVANGTIATAAVGDGLIDLTITPDAPGRVTVTVAGGTVFDLAGTPAAMVEQRFLAAASTAGFSIDGITLAGTVPAAVPTLDGTAAGISTTITPDAGGTWQQDFALPAALPATMDLDLHADGMPADTGSATLRITITGDPVPAPAGNG